MVFLEYRHRWRANDEVGHTAQPLELTVVLAAMKGELD